MEFKSTALKDVLLVMPEFRGDARGGHMEAWNTLNFSAAGLHVDFVQDNTIVSAQGTLHGLHYQAQQPQGRLTYVVRGNVFNVLVDMRRQSPTFGVWFGVELSMHRRSMVWSPPGFAHGVYVLSLQAEFVCKCTDFYHPQSEVVVRWNDPELDIDWPLLNGHAPILSPRDANGFSFAQAPKF